ncbi:MAG: peptide chain release factor N(5)-glutamine methyltransferase [Elusimicrobiota bacterium]
MAPPIFPRCSTTGEWLAIGGAHLAAKGVPEAQANAELILSHVLARPRLELRAHTSRPMSPKEGLRYWSLVLERSKRIPLAYVLGFQEFMGLRFKVRPCVLIPRPETEQLVEAVIEALAGSPGARSPSGTSSRPGPIPGPHILEIGAGSGCVSVALAVKLPSAVVYATDISKSALDLAEENARAHGVSSRVRFLREDLFKPAKAAAPSAKGERRRSGDDAPMGNAPAGWADALASNPPYIPSGDIPGLDEEVRKEPFLALDGGRDGLEAIRAIVSDSPRLLKPGGLLALELGAGQAHAVREILERPGRAAPSSGASPAFADVRIRKDLQGVERIVTARLSSH